MIPFPVLTSAAPAIPQPKEPLLRKAQAAELINVSLPTLDRYTRSGALLSVKLSNRAVRFRVSDIEAFLAERTRG
jgi:excisionase family DNA binding protein